MSDFRLNTDFFRRLSAIQNPAFLNRMVGQAGVIAVNFSKERFVQKNWLDENPQSWQARKRESRGSLLVVSGRLKRSIRKVEQGSFYVKIGTDVPYAQIHNEGGNINKTVTVRSHTRTRRNGRQNVQSHSRRMNLTMPKRQFLGNSKTLGVRIETHLSRMIDGELNR
ncbi:hypothetical protein CMU99_06785 [Elizabethkingia anophelis]|nr:hypothetical protein [Elizabethkingia anophelis]